MLDDVAVAKVDGGKLEPDLVTLYVFTEDLLPRDNVSVYDCDSGTSVVEASISSLESVGVVAAASLLAAAVA